MQIRFQTRSSSTAMAAVALVLATLPGAAATFPGATWETRTPAQVGLEAAKLDLLRDYVGGRGCVVRHGYMVYTWGDPAVRQDLASAVKPWYSHFLFKAVEDSRLASLDAKAVDWAACLNDLNPALAHKDRNITFRHMANQISGYGVSEAPGTAFDYNDFNMALLFDTLFLGAYAATYSNVDANVLQPLLTDVLQCEDSPTFLAFGTGDRPGRMRVSVRDFARFGLLYLNEGNWNGTQVISEAHATMAVTTPVPNAILRTTAQAAQMCPGARSIGSTTIPDNQTDHYGSYSFAWWTNGIDRNGQRHWPDAPVDTYGAFGHGNGKRAVTVMPGLDVVLSWNDTTLDSKPGNPRNEAFKRLVASVLDGPVPGQIVVDTDHPAHFKRHQARPFYMCGPGDPEGFLYRGTRNADGTRNGDQMDLINKVAGTGANCIYMIAVRSHGGDGDATHNPFINNNPTQPVNNAVLDQWELWFTAMDEAGITVFLFLYDDSSKPFDRDLPAGGQLKSEEAAFIDALVARFKDHKHLIWCVAEEYAEALSASHVAKIAERLRQMDDRQHPVGIHQNNGTALHFNGNSNFDQFTVQFNVDTAAELHAGALAARNNTGGMVNINMSEFAEAGTGAVLRRKLWAIAMAGAHSMVLGMDIASTPLGDLQDCGRVVRFMEATRFNETVPRDDLAGTNTDYVLAKPGEVYIAYGDAGASLTLTVTASQYLVKWYDPIDGDWVDQGRRPLSDGSQTFTKPAGIGAEAALYLERVPPDTQTAPGDFDGDSDVDQGDFGHFQTCLSGEANPVNEDCTDADLDGDTDVDVRDFIAFQACYSGANQLTDCVAS